MNNKPDTTLVKMFYTLLPVQILIFAMDSVNTIVDGAVAGQFIDPATVGVIGLYYSMVQIFGAVGLVFVGGSAVLCGRYIGRGEQDKTEGNFSMNLTIAFIIGLVLTLFSFLFPGVLAVILGADQMLKGSLVLYILGYSFGIIPLLLSKQIALFLQLEGQSARNYAGVIAMTISNIIFDIVLVSVLNMGVFGLALATSLSNIIYFVIIAPYFLSKKASLHFGLKKIDWSEMPLFLKTGIPGAILMFTIGIRYIFVNRILLSCSGADGLCALAAFNMVAGIYISFCLGNGSAVRVLVSLFVGEKDKRSIKKVVKIVLTNGMAIIIIISVILYLIAPYLASVFFPDRSSNVYFLCRQILEIYTYCLPFILICQLCTNYLQALGEHRLFIDIQSVFDGFFSVVIPAVILAPVMGALGVWYSNLIGVILVILTVPVYACIYWKRIPRTLDEWMFLTPALYVPEGDSLYLEINSFGEISTASEKISLFCKDHNIGERSSYYTALCFEEMADNVIRHGFVDDKKNIFNARVIYTPGQMMLRLKDDCKPFNPGEFYDIVCENGSGLTENIGIKMVYRIADNINYQYMMGLNIMTITVNEKNLLTMEKYDYLLEKTLKERDPDLHSRFKDMVFSVQNLLSRYKKLFPEFTDHTEFHSLTVIDSCNRLIGEEQIKKLNTDEIYILLNACYLHDVGMGISEKEYEEFKDPAEEEAYFKSHPDDDMMKYIRYNHQEFSGAFIEKYADLLEFPSPEHTYAIRQVSRGHRKNDLYDDTEFPRDYKLGNGNTVNLAYLSAIIRMADEIDVLATRNPELLYDIEDLVTDIDILFGKRVAAVRSMNMTRDSFILHAESDESEVIKMLNEMVIKMQETLDYCRDVIKKKSDFELTQKKVELILNHKGD